MTTRSGTAATEPHDGADAPCGSANQAPMTIATSASTDPTCHARGHVVQAPRYHGSGGRCTVCARTRGSSVRGALGVGKRFNSRSTRSCRSTGFIENRQILLQAFTPAMNVRLHLRQRDAEARGDFLVAHVLEMEENKRYPLMIRQRL